MRTSYELSIKQAMTFFNTISHIVYHILADKDMDAPMRRILYTITTEEVEEYNKLFNLQIGREDVKRAFRIALVETDRTKSEEWKDGCIVKLVFYDETKLEGTKPIGCLCNYLDPMFSGQPGMVRIIIPIGAMTQEDNAESIFKIVHDILFVTYSYFAPLPTLPEVFRAVRRINWESVGMSKETIDTKELMSGDIVTYGRNVRDVNELCRILTKCIICIEGEYNNDPEMMKIVDVLLNDYTVPCHEYTKIDPNADYGALSEFLQRSIKKYKDNAVVIKEESSGT